MFNILETETGVLLRIKVVPNARKDEMVGLIGDRLKVRVSAPPENGKANKAVCVLISKILRIKMNAVSVVSGESSPCKSVAIEGITKSNLSKVINQTTV